MNLAAPLCSMGKEGCWPTHFPREKDEFILTMMKNGARREDFGMDPRAYSIMPCTRLVTPWVLNTLVKRVQSCGRNPKRGFQNCLKTTYVQYEHYSVSRIFSLYNLSFGSAHMESVIAAIKGPLICHGF